MKVRSKTTAINATNRISALERLSKPTPKNNNNNKQIHQRLSAPTNHMITDARQLLTNRTTPIFDARQLLSRQSSGASNTSVIIRKDIVQTEEEDDEQDDDQQKLEVISILNKAPVTSRTSNFSFEKKNNTFLAVQNPKSTESISFTKTIKNTSFQREDDAHQFQTSNTQVFSSDKKVAISFVKDQSRKRPKSPSPTSTSPSPSPPPRIRRLHDVSIQTIHPSSVSRSPIQINSHRRHLDEHNDHHESPIKRISSRNTTIDTEQQDLSTLLKNSLKRMPKNASDYIRTKEKPSIQSNSDATTVLVTNLQSSVTEDDVTELFSEVGHIDEIITLSRGCVQIVYSKPEHAEEAVAKYHNRLLDGQLIYVSLQQPSSYATKSSKNSSSSRYSKSTTSKDNRSSQSINENEYSKSNSNKIVIDPTFMRQALFYPSNNTKNPVQFQVKL